MDNTKPYETNASYLPNFFNFTIRNPEFALIDNYFNGAGNNRPPTGVKPLYQYSNHAPITLNKAMHLLQFARQKHNMTDSCFECLLQLLSKGGLLPESNFLPSTIRSFQKHINLKSSIRPIVETEKFVIFDFVEQLKCIVSSRFSIIPVLKLSPLTTTTHELLKDHPFKI